jgi:hypothetical protein
MTDDAPTNPQALAITGPRVPQVPVLTEDGGELALSAQTPTEMFDSQRALICWCEGKMTSLRADHKELRAAYKHAVAHKWKSATLKRHADLALKRIDFYSKMKDALLAGYFIVPNFPVAVFAIRTTKDSPAKMVTQSERSNRDQSAEVLPAGQGEYKNPRPLLNCGWDYKVKDSGGGERTVRDWWAEDWDQFEFPLNMAKVQVMEATTRAMAMKIFDDLGVLPGHRRNEDPVIVGRIIDQRSNYKWSRKYITFMLAWHLDTRTL